MKKGFSVFMVLMFSLLFSASYATQGSIVISYTLDKNIYHPGEYGTLYLTIQNPTPYPVDNLDVQLFPGNYINLQTTSISLDNLPSGASQQTSFVFKINSSSLPSISEIKIHAEYYDYEQKKREYDIIVPVKIVETPQIKVYTEKDYALFLDKPEKICFKAINFGGEAKEVNIKFNSSTFSLTPNEFFFKKISKEQKFCARISTLPSTIAGIYPLFVFISYTDTFHDNFYQDNAMLWFNVSGLRKLIVYSESGNVKNSINIVFSNAGNEKIKSLYVKLNSDVEISPKEIYIGDLDIDDYDSEKISLKGSAGKHYINVTAFYRDVFENEHKENFHIEFYIQKIEEKKNYDFVYLIAFLIILAILWKVIKK